MLLTVKVYVTLLVSETGSGADETMTWTSAIPRIVAGTIARLLSVFCSISIAVSVALFVMNNGAGVEIVIDWDTMALFVIVPILKMICGPLVLQLPALEETARKETLVENVMMFVTPEKVVRPLFTT